MKITIQWSSVAAALTAGLFIFGVLFYTSVVNSRASQTCINIDTGRFEAIPSTGTIEFLVDGCDGEIHRWEALPSGEKPSISL